MRHSLARPGKRTASHLNTTIVRSPQSLRFQNETAGRACRCFSVATSVSEWKHDPFAAPLHPLAHARGYDCLQNGRMNGLGTFEFLRRHLNSPKRTQPYSGSCERQRVDESSQANARPELARGLCPRGRTFTHARERSKFGPCQPIHPPALAVTKLSVPTQRATNRTARRS